MGARLKDKVAIITGAGSVGPGWGNGKATAVLFAREGAKIFAVDVNQAAVDETRAIIESEGGVCQTHTADVSKPSDVEQLVQRCLATFGRIDILDNNVGINGLGGCVEASEETWDRVMDVNVKSMFLTCKHVLPVMEGQGSGAIINISSVASIRWLGIAYVAYSASKAAVNQLTQSIALQYAAKGIRANTILPGLINTPRIARSLAGAYAEGDVERMNAIRDAQSPTGKMGDAWDIANAALFLASDESRYVNGILLPVDGGLTCKID